MCSTFFEYVELLLPAWLSVQKLAPVFPPRLGQTVTNSAHCASVSAGGVGDLDTIPIGLVGNPAITVLDSESLRREHQLDLLLELSEGGCEAEGGEGCGGRAEAERSDRVVGSLLNAGAPSVSTVPSDPSGSMRMGLIVRRVLDEGMTRAPSRFRASRSGAARFLL